MAEAHLAADRPSLDLTKLPAVYVLPVHLSLGEVHDLEEKLSTAGATVTYDIFEARLVVGSVSTARRAKFELQCRRLRTEQVSHGEDGGRLGSLLHSLREQPVKIEDIETPAKKRRKVSAEHDEVHYEAPPLSMEGSTTDSEIENGNGDEDDADATANTMSQLSMSHIYADATALSLDPIEQDRYLPLLEFPDDHVKVVRVEWLTDSLQAATIQPIERYSVYEGLILAEGEADQSISTASESGALHSSLSTNVGTTQGILDRALADAPPPKTKYGKRQQIENALRRDFKGRTFASSTQRASQSLSASKAHHVYLLRETTSEHEDGVSNVLPEMPEWVKKGIIYACQRSTPLHTPNDIFIGQLKKVKLARILTGDDIGVRAYSTSIASIAAYPYKISSTQEIMALPGCDHKIEHLFFEWETTGRIQAVDEIDSDKVITTLKSFYNIWGVGPTTARLFYYDKGWTELDDIIEKGWHILNRVQQIGLKFYDEFEIKIPRSEVEYIASIVTYHAKKIVDDGLVCVVVGGYRRGVKDNGDVDIILSHRDESATQHLITPVITALENSGWITHILSVQTTNSDRDQQPVAYKFNDDKKRGGSFDTLDKALVVWQDPNWPSRAEDSPKNPNVHRRVDIIITPWRTVGCAVAGWTSGTTFQRDLRRYVKHVKGWKFDSSGVRERGTGRWIDLEGWTDVKTRAKSWQEAERRVFGGLGLEYREPEFRNTG